MTPDELTKEIIDMRDRVARIETSMETLIKQQCATDSLVQSVHELALSMQELTGQTKNIDVRLSNIENEKRSKLMTIWNTVIGTGLGIIISFVFRFIIKA